MVGFREHEVVVQRDAGRKARVCRWAAAATGGNKPAILVAQHGLVDAPVCIAKPAHHDLDDARNPHRHGLERRLERQFVNYHELGGLDGLDRCRTRQVVKQRHLADHRAFFDARQLHVLIRPGLVYPYLAFLDNKELPALGAFFENDFAGL